MVTRLPRDVNLVGTKKNQKITHVKMSGKRLNLIKCLAASSNRTYPRSRASFVRSITPRE